MTNLEQLRAEVEAKRVAKAQERKEKVEIRQLESELKRLDNDAYQDIKVKAEVKGKTTDKLKELLDEAQDIVASVPVYNRATKQDRKFNPTYRYGLGKQVELLTGLLSGIRYAVAEHKSMLLDLVQVSEDTIDMYLDGLGNLSYYSPRSHSIVESTGYDVDDILDAVMLINDALGINVDTSKITEKKLDQLEEIAINRAKLQFEEAELGKQMMDQVIDVA